jgi:hypothetical protein
MAADKSLFAKAQPPDNGGMTSAKPSHVTLSQWLALLAVWGLAAYGALAAPRAEARRDQAHAIACR